MKEIPVVPDLRKRKVCKVKIVDDPTNMEGWYREDGIVGDPT